MRVNGVSVPEAIRAVISRNRAVYDCLRMNVINYTALAVRIQDEVEVETGRPVNLNTLVVAIKRYADSFKDQDWVENERVLENSRMTLTDGMLDVRLSVGEEGIDTADILTRFSEATDNYDFFRVSDSVRFLVEDEESIRKILDDILGKRTYVRGLARIRISVPTDRSWPDAISFLADVLHNNGIELKDAFFNLGDITLVVDENQASRAYEILRSVRAL